MAHEEGRVANAGPGRKGVPQVPLYLESPEAEYIPTYLPSTCPLSLSHSCCLSLFFLPSRPIASLLPPPILESHRAPLVAGACVSYTAGSPRHDARYRATTGTDQWFVSPRRRRALPTSLSSSFSLFFSLSLPLSLLCYPVAHACNFAERVHSSCWLLVREAKSSKRYQAPPNSCDSDLEFRSFKINFSEHWIFEKRSFFLSRLLQ